MRFNPYLWTNDPLESQNWSLHIPDGLNKLKTTIRNSKKTEILMTLTNFHGEDSIILDNIKSQFKIICFTRDNPIQPSNVATNVGLFRGWGKPVNWAMYGDKHKGVCLMFEKTILDKDINNNIENCNIYKGNVIYTNNPLSKKSRSIKYNDIKNNRTYKSIISLIQKNIDNFFFQKLTDWQHELEYRWVVQSRSKSQTYINVPIHNSIKAIVMGCNISDENYLVIDDLKKIYKVKLYHLNWSNGTPMVY